MPVLPLVESRIMRLGLSLPERSPSSTMLSAARSLTDPPGLKYSALPRISMPGNSRETFSRRIRGVLPMVESKDSARDRTGAVMGSTLAMGLFLLIPQVAARMQPLHVAGIKGNLKFRLYHHPKVCQ